MKRWQVFYWDAESRFIPVFVEAENILRAIVDATQKENILVRQISYVEEIPDFGQDSDLDSYDSFDSYDEDITYLS